MKILRSKFILVAVATKYVNDILSTTSRLTALPSSLSREAYPILCFSRGIKDKRFVVSGVHRVTNIKSSPTEPHHLTTRSWVCITLCSSLLTICVLLKYDSRYHVVLDGSLYEYIIQLVCWPRDCLIHKNTVTLFKWISWTINSRFLI